MAKGDDGTLKGQAASSPAPAYTPSYDASLPANAANIDTSYLSGNQPSGTGTGTSTGTSSSPTDSFSDRFGGPSAGPVDLTTLGGGTSGGGTSPLSFSPSSPIATSPGASGPTGGGAPAFGPTSGIDLTGAFPDPTSNAPGLTDSADTFNDKFAPANAAIADGTFDQQGAANGSGGVNLTGLPTGGPAGPSNPNIAQVAGVPSNASAPASSPEIGGAAPQSAPTSQTPSLSQALNDTVANAKPITPTGTPSTPAAPGGSASSGGGTFLDKLAGGAANQLAKNPLGILAAGGGLALNAIQGNKDPEGLSQLRDAAATLKSTGSVLQTYLTTGTLPPGMQASVNQATAAAKARIVGNYASRGLSTDPAKNSALQQELAGVENQAIITAATLGDKLMTQGLSATGMAQQIYQAILNVDTARTKATGSAIANFASALAGGQTSGKIAA